MKLKSLLIEAGGKEPGKLEIKGLTYDKALSYLIHRVNVSDEKWEKFLKKFKKNFELLKVLVEPGYTERKDMPVVSSSQVEKLQQCLEQGKLDIINHKTKKYHKSFPHGLSEEQAKEWLKYGLKDGSLKDDIVKTNISKKTAKSLIPIQGQIYFDTAINKIIDRGISKIKKYINDGTYLIISKDNYIMDGHHRWTAAILFDPSITINCLVVDIPKEKLIELLLAYGEAIGNERNL